MHTLHPIPATMHILPNFVNCRLSLYYLQTINTIQNPQRVLKNSWSSTRKIQAKSTCACLASSFKLWLTWCMITGTISNNAHVSYPKLPILNYTFPTSHLSTPVWQFNWTMSRQFLHFGHQWPQQLVPPCSTLTSLPNHYTMSIALIMWLLPQNCMHFFL